LNNKFATGHIQTIKATSKLVDVRDGKSFRKDNWTISPEINPGVYSTSSKGKTFVFYTYINSISVKKRIQNSIL
jgi:hypothetical protein